ncbi:MAG: MFS transporter [Planctomycetaceae bacterium]
MADQPADWTDSVADGSLHSEKPTTIRYNILLLLASMAFILYLDRICIGQAMTDIKRDMGFTDEEAGRLASAFAIAYGIFEIPTGHWGDKYGSRGVITRIVVWWSIFTALTGRAWNLTSMLVIRFLFGAGEAGALPNTARVLRKWFPEEQRGQAQGIFATSMGLGGALSPIVTAQLIGALGWRWTFVVLGVVGALWSILFYWYFRDDPAEHPGTNQAEVDLIRAGEDPADAEMIHPPIPWGRVLINPNVWLLGAIMTCNAALFYVIFSWYPTYLQEAWGVTKEMSATMTSIVLAGGAVGTLTGGFVIDMLIRRFANPRWNRTLFSTLMLFTASGLFWCGLQTDSVYVTVGCLTLTNMCMQLTVPTWWSVVTNISGAHVGAMFGLMNMLGMPGSAGAPYLTGFLSDYYKNQGFTGRDQWDPAISMFVYILFTSATLWLFVDPRKKIGGDEYEHSPTEHREEEQSIE